MGGVWGGGKEWFPSNKMREKNWRIGRRKMRI